MGFRHKWVFVIFSILIVPTMAQADFSLKTKDGKSFTWANFTLEDDNYCTWNDTGKFCIPLSEVASIKEVASNPRPARPVEPTVTRGKITKELGQDSVDLRSNSSGHGRNFNQSDAYGNVTRSNTVIEKELTDEELRAFEQEKWRKERDAEARQRKIEDEKQVELTRQREAENRRRVERDEQRQLRDVDRLNRRHGFY